MVQKMAGSNLILQSFKTCISKGIEEIKCLLTEKHSDTLKARVSMSKKIVTKIIN